MSRLLLWTAPRLVGEMAAEELREGGLPVTTRFTGLETEAYPSNFVEIWLENEKLLEDFEVRQRIEDVIAAPPLKEEDGDKIAAMPFVDEPERPVLNLPFWVKALIGILIAVAVTWASLRLGLG